MSWIIVGAVVVIIVVWCILPNKTEYRCSKCGHTFMPKKSQLITTVHVGRKEMLKCPNCGESSMMDPVHKN